MGVHEPESGDDAGVEDAHEAGQHDQVRCSGGQLLLERPVPLIPFGVLGERDDEGVDAGSPRALQRSRVVPVGANGDDELT
jgi:hypothetical protein